MAKCLGGILGLAGALRHQLILMEDEGLNLD